MWQRDLIPTTSSHTRLIVLSGPDGSGKSTHARALLEDLRHRGIRAVYRRLRFPFLTTVPLLLYARLRGWSNRVRQGGYVIQAHAFGPSSLLRTWYPFTILMDLFLASLILVRLPLAFGRTVVCDRFILDTLVDAASSCERMDMVASPWLRLSSTLAPPRTTTILLTASASTLQRRRPELSIDPAFAMRSALYDAISQEESIFRVGTEDEFEVVHERILSHVTVEGASGERARIHRPLSAVWYASLRESSLPKVARQTLLLATHWLFQSVGAMGWTERTLKAAFGLFVFVAVFLAVLGPLGLVLAGVLAGLIAHTTNFLLNAHIPVVFKHLGREIAEERIRRYTEDFRGRMQGRSSLQGVVIVGSHARGESGPGSDLDVRLVARPGLKNALGAALLASAERALALVRRFPLDVYVADNIGAIGGLRESKNPIVLCDNTGSFGLSLSQLRAQGARD